MSDVTTSDPKFVPAASALSIVDMKVSQIKTDDALIDFVQGLASTRSLTDAQEAVAVYVARKRGHDFEWVLTNLGIDERSAKRREAEGMAIIRVQEITRTVSAIRTGSLGIKVVDEITAQEPTVTDDGVDSRIVALETLAAAKAIQSGFQTSDGKPLSDEQTAALVAKAQETVARKVEPVTARNLVRAVPNFSEQAGIVAKPTSKRKPAPSDSGPLGLESHFKAALRDAKAIVEASDGEAYVITPADAKALLDLLSFLGIDSETLAAIDALVAY